MGMNAKYSVEERQIARQIHENKNSIAYKKKSIHKMRGQIEEAKLLIHRFSDNIVDAKLRIRELELNNKKLIKLLNGKYEEKQ